MKQRALVAMGTAFLCLAACEDGPPLPDDYTEADERPLEGTQVARDEPCGAIGFTPALARTKLDPRRARVFEYTPRFEPGGARPVAAELEIQLDETIATCSPGTYGTGGGAWLPDTITFRGILLVRTADGEHDLRMPAYFSCDNLSESAELSELRCNASADAGPRGQRGSWTPPDTATDEASYSVVGTFETSLSLFWSSGVEGVRDSELSKHTLWLGDFYAK